MHQRRGGTERRHREEHAHVTDAADELTAAQAAQRKAEEVRGAHDADRYRRELFERRAHGQQGALQSLSGQQYGDPDQEGGNGRESMFHGGAFCSLGRRFGREMPGN